MAFKSDDEELAQRACAELHRRHARLLLGWCIKRRAETFGESAEDFVNTTFLKAYREAEHFFCTDRSQATNQVQAWLFRILKNLYLDSLRGQKRRPVTHAPDGEADWLVDVVEPQKAASGTIMTRRMAAVMEFLETLSAKDREILIVTAEFWNTEKGEAVLDDDIRDGICRDYGLTESSLRVRRKRLRDRGRAFVQDRLS